LSQLRRLRINLTGSNCSLFCFPEGLIRYVHNLKGRILVKDANIQRGQLIAEKRPVDRAASRSRGSREMSETV
jgi:hypothetical protein